jgi:hypothetical protein
LYTFIHSGQQSARARIRAQVVLKLGEDWSLSEICWAFDVCRSTVVNVRARFPEAERIYLVHDNLNTHTAGALYETFPQRRPGIFWTVWSSISRPSTADG